MRRNIPQLLGEYLRITFILLRICFFILLLLIFNLYTQLAIILYSSCSSSSTLSSKTTFSVEEELDLSNITSINFSTIKFFCYTLNKFCLCLNSQEKYQHQILDQICQDYLLCSKYNICIQISNNNHHQSTIKIIMQMKM